MWSGGNMLDVQINTQSEYELLLQQAMQQPGVDKIMETLNMMHAASDVLSQLNSVSIVRCTTSSSASQQPQYSVSI